MIRLAVAGAGGRMGKTILTLASRDPSFEIAAALERGDHPMAGEDLGPVIGLKPLGVLIQKDPLEALKDIDVFIDFTHASSTEDHLKAALKRKTAYVLGTTGLAESVLRLLRKASKKIPIVQSPNMSVGVNLLFKLAQMSAKVLDESYDIEISEIHHRHKKDAPSGTAMKLLEILAQARHRNPQKDAVFGRKGDRGARPRGQIGIFALRGGDVVGDHTLSFLGEGERLEITHRATSRESFARGALRAAKFIVGKRSGLYNMQQVLGI